MACIRKRREKWVVDYRDHAGQRKWVTCDTRREADQELSKAIRETRQLTRAIADPNITVKDYSDRWLEIIEATVKPRTLDSYTQNLALYILPRFGKMKLSKVHRALIKRFLAQKRASGLSQNTVRIIHATFRALLSESIEDGVISINPASGLGKKLKLSPTTLQRQDRIKAMDRGQLQAFLSAVAKAKNKLDRTYCPLFLLMGRTGIRIGESVALRVTDVDFKGSSIRVERGYSAGQFESPKQGHGRDVDMSTQLSDVLKEMLRERRVAWMNRGHGGIPELLFISQAGTILDGAKIRKVFNRALKAAGLPLHYTPHCLRHTYASILLQNGESPAYVQRMLGHASIKLTVDTYGKWLPMGNKAAADRLDDEQIEPSKQEHLTQRKTGMVAKR